MTGESDRDLPLHDEAKARSKWRGGETKVDKGGTGDSGPASEVDDDAKGSQGSGDPLLKDLAQRPPD